MKQQNPLLFSVFGLFLIIFGIVDFLFLNKTVGITLLIGGIVLAAFGIVRYRKIKQ